jgi:hypothetical protein
VVNQVTCVCIIYQGGDSKCSAREKKCSAPCKRNSVSNLRLETDMKRNIYIYIYRLLMVTSFLFDFLYAARTFLHKTGDFRAELIEHACLMRSFLVVRRPVIICVPFYWH